MLRKAGARGADVLIVDLEDGVLPAAKESAREQAQQLWHTLDFAGAEVWLRVNAAGTHWHLADLDAARVPGVAGLLFGAADFRASIRAGRDPDEAELLVARSTLVLAARAAEARTLARAARSDGPA
jgi:citrate lyase beta subunit